MTAPTSDDHVWFDDDVQMLPDEAVTDQRRYSREEIDHWVRVAIDTFVVAACVLFVFVQLGPRNIFADTTPAGGDMGAHVWGPAYLRDELLPNLRIAGWAPDWYNGFPAYQFYMVVPSLLIVLLDVGIEGPLAVVPLGLAVGSAVYAALSWSERRKRNLGIAGALVAAACIGLPYGVAFKLVTISGALSLPIAAYVFGRLAGLRFPTPAALAAATLPFLFYRGFSIYGGNLPSTLAGEFAFSMSLSFALVYLGLVMRGLETGKHRALAALFLALTALCHIIPLFWALAATAIVVILRPRASRPTMVVPAAVLAAIGAVIVTVSLLNEHVTTEFFLTAWPLQTNVWFPGWQPDWVAIMWVGVGLLVAAAVAWLLFSYSVRWLVPVLAVGGLLAAFWVGPFFLRKAYLNDMGWEPLPHDTEVACPYGDDPETGNTEICNYLFPREKHEEDLRWAFFVGLIGVGLSLALRIRAGIFLFASVAVVGFAFVRLGIRPGDGTELPLDGRLWNARVLPFYYLAIILLAAIALAEAARLIAQLWRGDGREPPAVVGAVAAVAIFVASFLYVGLPLGSVPGSNKLESGAGGYGWPSFSENFQFEASPGSYVRSWADWNYSGYERKPSYAEYYDIVNAMGDVGEQHGCGRAFWEYQKELDRYGTPMALMLLPYWTDGCIGSQEGLYFEASATTPFHFLMQTELSVAPSAAQRELPYSGFDITRGVQHLQMMGVKYYMAISPQAVAAADGHPELTKLAESGPWSIYEVADAPIVEALAFEPAVLEDVGPTQKDWLEDPKDADGKFYGPSIQWFTNPAFWQVQLAADGPEAWQRVDVAELPDARPVPEAEVSNIDTSESDRISFDVDRVGSPVLVKASYFPNWKVDGALGPWRVAPNLMVVVPTERHVELHYGNTSVEWLAYALTAVGLAGLVFLVKRKTYAPLVPAPAAAGTGDDGDGSDDTDSADAGTPAGGAGALPPLPSTDPDGDEALGDAETPSPDDSS